MLIYVLQIYQATNSSPTFSPCKGTKENNFTGGCQQSCVPLLKSYLEMYISAYFHKEVSALVRENSWRVVTLEPSLKVKDPQRLKCYFPAPWKEELTPPSSPGPWSPPPWRLTRSGFVNSTASFFPLAFCPRCHWSLSITDIFNAAKIPKHMLYEDRPVQRKYLKDMSCNTFRK